MILAAGEGTRLRPLTLSTPKPMVPIANIPLLERTLRWLSSQGVQEAVINLHHRPQVIRDAIGDGQRLGLRRVQYSLEETLLGTAGAVKKCQDFFSDAPFFVIYGDNLIEADLRKLASFHYGRSTDATIALFRADDPSACGLVTTDEAGTVTRFQEKPPQDQIFTNLANAGVYVLEPSLLQDIPADCPYDFGKELFPSLLAQGRRLSATLLDGYLQDTGTPAQYRKANADVLLGRAPNVRGQLIKNPPNYTLIADGAEVAPRVHFRGINVIGQGASVAEGAHLTDCILWDRASVGKDAHLIRAILGTEASVMADQSPPEDLILGKEEVFG
ncbi:MAG TPA: NDP-sugar synthase [Capsulimonadaceae bacterium]|nr:NDP-sugar synthase [Capsulimonadaceae bacterium]